MSQARDANTCYYLFADLNSGDGSVWKTTEGGSIWTKKSTTQFNGSWADFIHLFSQNNCLVLGDPVNGYFDIQISQDGGDTWTRVPQANIPAKLPVESGIGGISYSAIGNTICFATSAGRCFKSVDGGNNWTAVMVEPGTVHQIWQVCFIGFAVIYGSLSPIDSHRAFSHGMNTANFSVSSYPALKADAFPVRCLQD